MKVSPIQIHLLKDKEVNKEVETELLNCIEKLKEGIPLQYITGKCYFMDFELIIKEGVLIPRPETELLVEKVMELLGKDFKGKGFDIGGGTGCISIALLRRIENLVMFSNDINPTAVELMKENAKIHKVDERLSCRLGNLFEPFQYERFDFIVSNPPYIPKNKWYYLDEAVKKEGYNSLIGGEKGIEFYKYIAEGAKKILKDKGFIALEIGHDQGNYVKTFFKQKGFNIEICKDYNYQDRIVIAWR